MNGELPDEDIENAGSSSFGEPQLSATKIIARSEAQRATSAIICPEYLDPVLATHYIRGMRERFELDQRHNILFIDLAGLRIESREQVDEMGEIVQSIYSANGRRFYAVVNYEGAEIVPEIIDYYGERIKNLYDLFGIATMRYASSGFTRSALRYLGAAKDLESNLFATRAEAIRAIQEIERRSGAEISASGWSTLLPARSVMGKLLAVWLATLTALLVIWTLSLQLSFIDVLLVFLPCMLISLSVVFFDVVRPLRQMEVFARRMVAGGAFEPLNATGKGEAGRLALALNETATQLRRDLERLSGLYHIALLIGAGAEVSRVGELLTRKIARLLDAEMCVILIYDEHDQSIYAQSPGYGVGDNLLRTLQVKLEQKSVAAQVIRSGEPYLTNDAAHDPLVNRAAADLLGARELLAVPLQTGERVFGVLEVINRPGGFLEEDRRIVTVFASQAAQLLANARLLEKEREMTRHLIASERLAAVGELIAGVAHEVRNPLCGITTTLSALSRKLEDREAARPFLDVINVEVGRLNHLMEELLEHSSPVRVTAEPADIREVMREAVAEFKGQAEEKNVTLICDCATTAPGIRFDSRKMHRVFVNLLDNALQHTGEGGRVRVMIAGTDDIDSADRRIQIEVVDTGSGIAPENIGRVFEPFFTTRANGAGLGLAITRKTIHDHGGVISVKSELGKGTCFTITLPIGGARGDRN
jgi:signal transduction histidine kinase/HAMP domain-containing protein